MCELGFDIKVPRATASRAANWRCRVQPYWRCSYGLSVGRLPLDPPRGAHCREPPDELQGYRVFGEFDEHVVIALERQGKLLPGERFVGQARQLAQPDRPRVGFELRVDAKDAHQLVNRNLGAAPLDHNIVDRSDAEALSCFLEDAVADADASAEFLVYSLEAGGDVDTVANHGVAHPLLGAEVADQHRVAVNADPDVQRLQFLLIPAIVQQVHAALDAQGGDTGVPGMVFEQDRRPREGHHAVADELVDRAGLLVDDPGDELEIGRNPQQKILGGKLFGKCRERLEVGEEDRQEPAMPAEFELLIRFEKLPYQAHGHESGKRLDRGVERIDCLGEDRHLANRRFERRQVLAGELLDLGDLESELLEWRRDDGRQKIDDEDLQRDRNQPEEQQAIVVLLQRAGEVAQRRNDEKLPSLAELRRQCGNTRDVLLAGMGK